MGTDPIYRCLVASILSIAAGGCALTKPPDVACTMEAKVCPDGSYVGRNPAKNCEFNPCPK